MKPPTLAKLLKIRIRRARKEDRKSVFSILGGTKVFRQKELEVAREVFNDALKKRLTNGYLSFVAHNAEKIIGWICFGPTPGTVGTFDIYWIAVAPSFQRCGIGSQLVGFAEDKIKEYKGRLVAIDTSANARYKTTRSFYEKNRYQKTVVIRNFYAPGDHKIIYIKPI
jgi:ribosomal protein S18 acetylase RimI-like enzyme